MDDWWLMARNQEFWRQDLLRQKERERLAQIGKGRMRKLTYTSIIHLLGSRRLCGCQQPGLDRWLCPISGEYSISHARPNTTKWGSNR